MNVIDAHYFLLPSQGNVYSLTKLSMVNGRNKVLVASLRRKVYSFEFLTDSTGEVLQPTVKEILFTYIPSGAEIVSIDAFNKSESRDEFVIGITIIKSSGEPNEETYLNIYSEWEPSTEFNLDNVAQSCLMIELNFIPYQLYHTDLYTRMDTGYTKEVVWLLSGNDGKVHLFREDKLNHCYCEVNVEEHFAEFSKAPSIILWMDVVYTQDISRRISAYGCECGYVQLTIVDLKSKEIAQSWSLRSEGPISSVRLFTKETNLKCPSFVMNREENYPKIPPINLLVANTLKPSLVFMDVVTKGLGRCRVLPVSNQHDVVLSSCIADINMDGNHEVLLGTFGHQVLAYSHRLSDGSQEDDEDDGWTLCGYQSLSNPVQCLLHVDVTGDGARELIAVTLRGVHVMQNHPDFVRDTLARRMKQITLLPDSS